MKQEIQRYVSLIAGYLCYSRRFTQVYDYQTNKNYLYSLNSGSLYDYSRQSFVTFMNNVKQNNGLYDYKLSKFITFSLNGETFNGYDYDSGSFYTGIIQDNMVRIYSYKFGKYFSYRVA